MRRKYKRTVTTVESREVLRVNASTRILCTDCDDAPQMLTLAEAAWQANVGQRAVCQLIEAGLIHFAETKDGGLFVCLGPLRSELDTPAGITARKE